MDRLDCGGYLSFELLCISRRIDYVPIEVVIAIAFVFVTTMTRQLIVWPRWLAGAAAVAVDVTAPGSSVDDAAVVVQFCFLTN